MHLLGNFLLIFLSFSNISGFIHFLVLCVENKNIYLNQNVFLLQVFALVGFILVQCSQHSGSGRAQFFSTIAMIAFWFSGILLVLYLFHVIYVFSKIPWTKIEFFFCLGACLLLALSSAILIAGGNGFFTAAGVSRILFNCAKVKWDLDIYKWISLQHNELTLEKKSRSKCAWKSFYLKIIILISITVCFIFQFFGFVAMCAYGYDAYLKYRLYNTVVTNVVTRTTTVTVA